MFPNVKVRQIENTKGNSVEVREAVTLTNQGKKIFGVIHRPLNASGPCPGVVICPGFGGNKSGKFRVFVEIAEQLAKQGIAVLRFDYRGAGDSEGEFSAITIESQVSDALAALDFLAQDNTIDTARLGIVGRSLGGMISVLASSRYHKVKSVALWAPVFTTDHWKTMWRSLSMAPVEVINQGIKKLIPNLPAVPSIEFLTQFFAIDLQKELMGINQIPLLHIHGNQDEVIKIDHAHAYKHILEANHRSRFLELPKSNHDFTDEAERRLAIRETCHWFTTTLGDQDGPS